MTSIRATPYGSGAWDYDACQTELDSSSWGCRGTAPEVSISGILFEGTFTGTARDRIQGSLQVRYQHRADDTQPYAGFVATEDFTLTQVAK
jgi:hypothetical protein